MRINNENFPEIIGIARLGASFIHSAALREIGEDNPVGRFLSNGGVRDYIIDPVITAGLTYYATGDEKLTIAAFMVAEIQEATTDLISVLPSRFTR